MCCMSCWSVVLGLGRWERWLVRMESWGEPWLRSRCGKFNHFIILQTNFDKISTTTQDDYLSRLPDLHHHTSPPSPPSSHSHPPSSLPSPPPNPSPTDSAVLSHHLTILHDACWTLNDKLKRYRQSTLPLPWAKRKRLGELVIKVVDCWREVVSTFGK